MQKSIPLKDIQIDDAFFTKRIETARNVSINYMWRALNDEIEGIPPSGCIKNFKIACGLEKGEFFGYRFQDSDLYKWLEAVAYSLESQPDAELEGRGNNAIKLIAGAQLENGYINTSVTLQNKIPWSDTCSAHEMYCAGHMMEAAAAWKNATGNDDLMEIACRFADHIDSVFGPEAHKKKGYPGHQEIELGLMKLYGLTGNKRYLNLAKFFLDARGVQPFYYDMEQEERVKRGEQPLRYYRDHGPLPYSYQQAHLPVREQKEAVGHAVRCVYMLSGMADVGAACDDSLLNAARDLYENIVNTQMYITGGIGSMGDGEAFSFPYDLPNDRMYNETCASIGLMMACQRLLHSSNNSQYADTMERALYNTVLAGVSLDGKKFFYVNPMEVWPKRSQKRHDLMDVKAERQGWYGCACCPPNVLRTLLGLGQYVYSQDDSRLNIDLYVGSTVSCRLNGTAVQLKQTGNYPYFGTITITLTPEQPVSFDLALRLPGWQNGATLTINGETVPTEPILDKGYAVLKRTWQAGDTVILHIPMTPQYQYCDDRVPFNAGLTALTRGPLVYCVEERHNGAKLWNLLVDTQSAVAEEAACNELGSTVTLLSAGYRQSLTAKALYTTAPPKLASQHLHFIPYYAWGNGEPGEMRVWLRTHQQE